MPASTNRGYRKATEVIMALEAMARAMSAEHGYMVGKGEIVEFVVPVQSGEIPADAAARGLDRLNLGGELPKGAWYSARVNLEPHRDDAENYKSLNGFSEVPTDPYKNGVAFSESLLRLTDNVAAKQKVISVAFRVAIPPQGFFAMHGDGLLKGPRVALVAGNVYQEGPKGGAKKVTQKRYGYGEHPRSWMKGNK